MSVGHCPECGAHVTESLADHGVAVHGLVRPQIVTILCGLLAAAAALCGVQVLRVLADLGESVGFEAYERLLTALFLLVILVIGAYGAALALIARMVWQGDRVGRVLAYLACGPIAMAGLFGAEGDAGYLILGLLAIGVIGALAFVPDVTAWFTGPFALHRAEPAVIVAARVLIAWSTFLAGVGALSYLIIATVDSGKVGVFVCYGAGAGLLGTGFLRLRDDDPVGRTLAAAGAGAVLFATVVAGETTVGFLAIAGPAIAAAVVLWLVPEATAYFEALAQGGTPERPPTATPTTWPGGSSDPTSPAPAAAPGQWADAPVTAAVAAPPSRDPSRVDLTHLPPPVAGTRVPAGPVWAGGGLEGAAPDLAIASGPGAAGRSSLGFTSLSANRCLLLLVAAGATVEHTDGVSGWLTVAGARIVVGAGDMTRVLIEAETPEHLARISRVTSGCLHPADPAFALAPSDALLPQPRVMPGFPPRGWYADPFDAHLAREWDGTSWTDRTATPVPGPAAPPPPSSIAPPPPMPATEAAQLPTPSPWRPPPTSAHAAAPTGLAPVPTPALGRPSAWAPGEEAEAARSHALATVGALLFGALMLGGLLLPFQSFDGESSGALVEGSLRPWPLFAAPVVALLGGVLCALGSRAGLALAAGVSLSHFVFVAQIAEPLGITLGLVDDEVGFGGPSPAAGAVCIAAATVLGVVLLFGVLASWLRGRGERAPVAVVLVALAAAVAYVVGIVDSSIPGYDVFLGDGYSDASFVLQVVGVAVPVLALVVTRTAAAATVLVGALVYPAAGWMEVAFGSEVSSFQLMTFNRELAGSGLTVLGAVALAGALWSDRRPRPGAIPARPAAVVAAAIVGIGGFAGVARVASEDPASLAAIGEVTGYVEDEPYSDDYVDESYEEEMYEDTYVDEHYDDYEVAEDDVTWEDTGDQPGDYGSPYSEFCVDATADPTPLNLRSGPGGDYSIETSIPADECDIYDYDPGGQTSYDDNDRLWRRVTWGSWDGWVADWLIYET